MPWGGGSFRQLRHFSCRIDAGRRRGGDRTGSGCRQHQAERTKAGSDARFQHDGGHARTRDPDAVLALEIHQRVAAILETDLGVIPGHALARILQNEVVLRAASDPDGLLLQFALVELRLAAKDD